MDISVLYSAEKIQEVCFNAAWIIRHTIYQYLFHDLVPFFRSVSVIINMLVEILAYISEMYGFYAASASAGCLYGKTVKRP